MITSSNLKDLLVVLGFAATGNVYEKRFRSLGVSLSVNFDTKKLIFPAEIKGRDRNTGFDAPENLVVFECVNRLLEKGYRPEHIELEKEWHLGHDAKADVQIFVFQIPMVQCCLLLNARLGEKNLTKP